MNDTALYRPELAGEDDIDSTPPGSVYARLREDIIEGRIAADSRLKIRDLAARYDVSTNPVREALQQLRGEGFVIITPNRGARVRPIDETFLRDTNEIELLIEPYLTRCFVDVATAADIQTLEIIQDEIEALNFADVARNAALDAQFHWLMYRGHPNGQILEMWWKYRHVLSAVTRRFPIALGRQTAVKAEHRELLRCLKAHDADGAEALMRQHVAGSGRHMIQQMRSMRSR